MSYEHLIVLNGASSSGKTTLCKALQEVLSKPYIHLEEDRFVYDTYHARHVQSDLGGQIFAKTMLGYYRSLRAFASAGHNVLADMGFYSTELLRQFVNEVQGFPVWLVGVHCSITELELRESARGDRQTGLAREQSATIHSGVLYDIEVDTTEHDGIACALQIKAIIESGKQRPAAIAKLRALA